MCGDCFWDAGGGEGCDDGNIADGDGCDSTCNVEAGWNCVIGADGVKSTCTEIADDGLWMGQLACDDGDADNANGCSNAGTINAGYY